MRNRERRYTEVDVGNMAVATRSCEKSQVKAEGAGSVCVCGGAHVGSSLGPEPRSWDFVSQVLGNQQRFWIEKLCD